MTVAAAWQDRRWSSRAPEFGLTVSVGVCAWGSENMCRGAPARVTKWSGPEAFHFRSRKQPGGQPPKTNKALVKRHVEPVALVLGQWDAEREGPAARRKAGQDPTRALAVIRWRGHGEGISRFHPLRTQARQSLRKSASSSGDATVSGSRSTSHASSDPR